MTPAPVCPSGVCLLEDQLVAHTHTQSPPLRDLCCAPQVDPDVAFRSRLRRVELDLDSGAVRVATHLRQYLEMPSINEQRWVGAGLRPPGPRTGMHAALCWQVCARAGCPPGLAPHAPAPVPPPRCRIRRAGRTAMYLVTAACLTRATCRSASQRQVAALQNMRSHAHALAGTLTASSACAVAAGRHGGGGNQRVAPRLPKVCAGAAVCGAAGGH